MWPELPPNGFSAFYLLLWLFHWINLIRVEDIIYPPPPPYMQGCTAQRARVKPVWQNCVGESNKTLTSNLHLLSTDKRSKLTGSGIEIINKWYYRVEGGGGHKNQWKIMIEIIIKLPKISKWHKIKIWGKSWFKRSTLKHSYYYWFLPLKNK